MTALNQKAREAILKSVVASTYIPQEVEAILASTGAAVRALVLQSLPAGFIEATKDLPPEWFRTESSMDILKAQNPRCIMDGPERWKHSSYAHISFEKVRVPSGGQRVHTLLEHDKDGNAESYGKFWGRHLAAQIDAATKLRAKQEALEAELMGFLLSCKNHKQVLAKMPELERHLPVVEKPALPLVVSTAKLGSQLSKLGFDLGAAK